MAQKELPPDMVNYFKRGKKAKNRRMNIVLAFFVVIIIGIILVFAYFLSPTLAYFIPSTEEEAEANPASSLNEVAPSSFSMGSILGSIGLSDSAENLEITETELHSDASSWVTGKVTNTGTEPYEGFTIYYDLYDGNGNFVGSSYALMSHLGGGESTSFKTMPLNQPAASAKLKYVMGGSLDTSAKDIAAVVTAAP